MPKTCRAVVFDIGNVFVRWDPRFLYNKLIPDADELEYFLREVVTLEWHSEHDRGRPFAEGVRMLSEQFPQYAELIEAFDTRWSETITSTIPGTIDVLDRLVAADVPVYALTNFSAEKFPGFCEEYAFTRQFKGIVVSGEEKLIKPDPKIFDVTLERFNLKAEETLFIDDRLENVQAAEAKGMIGHQFTDATTLAAYLKSLSL